MKQLDRTRQCNHCEADVSNQATYCPFCGSDLLVLQTEELKESSKSTDRVMPESLASLDKPPYSARGRQGLGIPDEREEPVFVQAKPIQENLPNPQKASGSASLKKDAEEGKKEAFFPKGSIWPLLLLSIGGYLFALGLLVLLCSKDGVLALEWRTRFWFLYWLLSLPFLFFGTRRLKKIG